MRETGFWHIARLGRQAGVVFFSLHQVGLMLLLLLLLVVHTLGC